MLADEIAQHLDDQVVTGGATGWVARTGRLTESQDQMVLVTGTSGEAPEAGGDMERPSFQVLVRGAVDGITGARAKADEILGELHRFIGSAGGKAYIGILAVGSPFTIAYDESERPLVATNYRTMRSRS
jgi:hypothetical protein